MLWPSAAEDPYGIEFTAVCSMRCAEVAASFRMVRLTPPGQQWLYREPIVLGATVHQADPKPPDAEGCVHRRPSYLCLVWSRSSYTQALYPPPLEAVDTLLRDQPS